MSPRSKREYVEAVFLRYKQACKSDKGRILDEFCATCGYHRKYAIRLLRKFKRFTQPKPKRRGAKPIYHHEAILKPLKKIWLTANLPCSKRLKAVLPLWLPGYQVIEGRLPADVFQALLRISPASIDRLLKPLRVRYRLHGRCTTKPGTLLRQQIPVGTNQWDQSRPGFLEADTVAHCGASMAGQFAYTLDCVDIATGWSEQRAAWGRGETGVLEQIRDIERYTAQAIHVGVIPGLEPKARPARPEGLGDKRRATAPRPAGGYGKGNGNGYGAKSSFGDRKAEFGDRKAAFGEKQSSFGEKTGYGHREGTRPGSDKRNAPSGAKRRAYGGY